MSAHGGRLQVAASTLNPRTPNKNYSRPADLHLNSPPDSEKESYFQRMNKFEDLLRKHTWFSVGSTKVMHGTGTLANG